MIESFTGRWRFLSNFYPVEIQYKGIKYPSVENFYVAMKIKEDQVINNKFMTLSDCQELISKIKNPSEVKKLGKSLKVRKDWNEIKLKIMEWAVNEKFKNIDLAKMLLETGDEQLIEGNWWGDVYWGICNGKGENNLGKILMKIRERIKNKEEIIVDFPQKKLI